MEAVAAVMPPEHKKLLTNIRKVIFLHMIESF